MKKLLILCTIFASCSEPPVLNNEENPFIVSGIEAVSATHALYTDFKANDSTTHIKQSIVLHRGLYNIGDTIYFYKFDAQPLKK
jgi:hypothetical protein